MAQQELRQNGTDPGGFVLHPQDTGASGFRQQRKAGKNLGGIQLFDLFQNPEHLFPP